MTRLFLAIVLLLATYTPAAAAKPSCKVVYGSGKRYCVCWLDNRWAPAPMLACKLRR